MRAESDGPVDDSIFDAGAGRSRRRRGLPRAMPMVSNPRSYGDVTHDTILNDRMKPMFAGEPAVILRRIRYGISDDWTQVLVGETKQIVTIAEYLHGDKHKTTVKMLEELIAKKDMGMYKRDPSQYAKLVDRTALRLIQRIMNDD